MQTCPACGQENPEGFRLCGMCGAVLTAAAPAGREERKIVTILFTDLVGSTAAAERLDPEDVRKILSPYYSRLRAEIERHGGTVEKFIGDAVMAVFGAPVAHEDDPERAVRAALAIRDALADSELQIRTAVNTGEALVALGARPAEGEGMVSGDVVNTTARLQGAAPVNGIIVGEATHRATRHAIDYREAPVVEAKGKSAPVPVWEVVGARAAFGSDVEQKLRTPLVGRERERGLLADALARVRGEQSVQLVTLIGVPGIGKSRLVAELFQIVDAEPELIAWRQGRSLPYGESGSFWALGEIVKAHAGILETDDAGPAETKLATMLDSLVPDAQEREWLATAVRPLVGLEGDERTDQATAFSAWRRLLEAAAEERPLVLVFEDLHWADDGLLDFVDHLADWSTTVPLLLVATARPELLDRRPAWSGGKRNALTLSIGALTNDETAQLLQRLLDRSVLPAEAQQSVLRRAEGNPLYAEEFARMLQDHGGDGDLSLPESVQGLIAARIDALSHAEKTVLQEAAVIGKVFWPGAVEDAGDDVLHALERKEFVRRDRRSAIAGETQYAFLHALVRDVAYSQIPRARRSDLHGRAAAWIASLSADRSDDRAQMLAHHYVEALSLAEAAGLDAADLRAPAREALADASERALALNSFASARDLAQKALELTDEGDMLRYALQLRVADARSRLDEFDFELALAARDGFVAGGDVVGAARAEILLSWLSFHTGRGPSGRGHSRHAVELLAGLPPSPLHAVAHARLARRLALTGEPLPALDEARRALALAEEFGDDRTASDALNTIGLARGDLGEPEGLDDLREAVVRAERANAPHEGATAWNNLTNQLWRYGRLAEAAESWQAGYDLCVRYGYTSAVHWAEMEAVLNDFARGYLTSAAARAETILSKTRPGFYMESALRTFHGLGLALRGGREEALAETARALEHARPIGDPQMIWPVLAFAAAIHWADGDRDAAVGFLDEITASADYVAYEPWTTLVPFILFETGNEKRYAEDVETRSRPTGWTEAGLALAARDPARAAEIYGAMGARFFAAWAQLLAAEQGEASHVDDARGYFVEEGMTVFMRRCDALLQASA